MSKIANTKITLQNKIPRFDATELRVLSDGTMIVVAGQKTNEVLIYAVEYEHVRAYLKLDDTRCKRAFASVETWKHRQKKFKSRVKSNSGEDSYGYRKDVP